MMKKQNFKIMYNYGFDVFIRSADKKGKIDNNIKIIIYLLIYYKIINFSFLEVDQIKLT